MQLFLTPTTMGSFIPGRLILVNSIYQQLLQYFLRNFYLSKFVVPSEIVNPTNLSLTLFFAFSLSSFLTRTACNWFQYDCLSCYGHYYQWSAQLCHPAGKSYPPLANTTGIYFSHLWVLIRRPYIYYALHPEKL